MQQRKVQRAAVYIFQQQGDSIRKLGEVVLNTTVVSDNHAEKNRI